MKIACIDDDRNDGETLLHAVTEAFHELNLEISCTDLYHGADEFLSTWHPGLYDLIFLDIFLEQDKNNGIDIAHTIRASDRRVQLVFCSSSNDFATESYSVGASYYMTKPINGDSVSKMISRLGIIGSNQNDFLILPDSQKLLLSHILFSEYHNHQILIYLKDGRTIKTWLSQSDFIRLLEPYDYFLSINPGTVLNMHEVANFQNNIFCMNDGHQLSVSMNRKKEIKKQYEEFLFKELRKM